MSDTLSALQRVVERLREDVDARIMALGLVKLEPERATDAVWMWRQLAPELIAVARAAKRAGSDRDNELRDFIDADYALEAAVEALEAAIKREVGDGSN